MTNFLRRLSLGIVLICLVSAILLVSDWNRRSAGKQKLPRVALFQFASRPLLDEGSAGVIEALKSRGFVPGQSIQIDRYNSENDLPTANSISRAIVDGGYDLAITVSTPCLQSFAAANKAGKVTHVFGLVTDPFASGVGLDREHPDVHPRHLVGIGTFQPVRDALTYAKRSFPALRRVGTVWNPAEACSEACMRVARRTCKELGIELLEAQSESSTGVAEATNSVVSRGVEAIFIGGDNTVEMSIKSVIRAADEGRIPVIGCAPGHAELGALIGLGADYFEVGRTEGEIAADVLAGKDPAKIRIGDVMPQKLALNLSVISRLRNRWSVPQDVVDRAVIRIEPDGRRWEKGRTAPAAAQASGPIAKKWKIHLIELINAPSIDETRDGIRQGLKEAGLMEGRDYELKVGNAQGDLPTLSGLVDAAITQQADMVYTITTPALQTAMRKIQDRPVLFALALDPLLVGDRGTHDKHRPNVAGVYDRSPFEEMLKLVRECLPKARSIGTLYAPSESNSVQFRAELEKAARTAGLQLVALSSNSATEAADAAAALTQRGIDAICQINDNLHGAAFPAIVAAARRAKLPVFSFSTGQISQGAAVVLSNDHFDGGRESALIAARVMRGESPSSFPYRGIAKTRLLINREAASLARLTIPESVARRAEK
ncbi:MAG: ABC transporter substrate-binding protein [Acidobacteriales bacterium]|nr:ABC transporter substrate-binding protein [Terriglobales bacterium]